MDEGKSFVCVGVGGEVLRGRGTGNPRPRWRPAGLFLCDLEGGENRLKANECQLGQLGGYRRKRGGFWVKRKRPLPVSNGIHVRMSDLAELFVLCLLGVGSNFCPH